MRQRVKIIEIVRHRLSTDGDGVTTLVAFHGCPVHCSYCLNPQSLDDGCRFRKYSLEGRGNQYRQSLFHRYNGGVTFGGEESCLRTDFTREFCGLIFLLNLETSLNVPVANIEALLTVVNTLIFDIINPDLYCSYTSKSNAPVLDNLRLIAKTGRQNDCIVRIPLRPNYNTNANHKAIRKILEVIGFNCFDLFIYKPTNTLTMARGKQTCKIQKEICRQIAETNDIDFVILECRSKRACFSTSSNQSNETLQGELAASIVQTEAVDSIDEEGKQPVVEDTASDSQDLHGVKEGEIVGNPNIVVFQREVPDELSANPNEKGIYECIERPPEFLGGNVEMLHFINQHLIYPEEQYKY